MNKGFTLVELLAVIVIIMAVSLITTVSINNILRDSKKKFNKLQKNIIVDATGMWLVDHLDLIPDEGTTCIYITLEELEASGAINDLKNLNTLEELPAEMKIKVDITDTVKYNITVDAKSVNGCYHVQEYVPQNTSVEVGA